MGHQRAEKKHPRSNANAPALVDLLSKPLGAHPRVSPYPACSVAFLSPGQKCELWLCGCVFTLADVLLGATLHRLKFLGLSKKYWEDGSRPNLQSFFDRIQKRFAFRKVLGDIHTTLLSAVVPNAFRLVKRKPPSFFGASFLMGSLGGMGYFAYWYLKKKYI